MIMISLDSQYRIQMVEVLNDFSQTSAHKEWREWVKNPRNDGTIEILLSQELKNMAKALGIKTIKDFFLNIEEFTNYFLNPSNERNPNSVALYDLWDTLKKNINDALTESRTQLNIPDTGGVLVFIGGLSLCLVIRFYRKQKKLQIVDVIEGPKSAFDFWGSVSTADMSNKNILKELISSGHKLIYHRGILMHIDRRKDQQVFGPSIDTMLMNEILVQHFYEKNLIIPKALEIGCGNGMLTVSLAKFAKGLEMLVTIDINFNAITCTHNNLNGNLTEHEIAQKNIIKINGNFDPEILPGKFDLIVCNPPYIPIPKSHLSGVTYTENYFTAVGGLEVIDKLLDSLDSILNKNGTLFLLISSVSYEYVMEKIDSDLFEISEPLENGHKVLFDVEAVFNNQTWFDFLLESSKLIKEGEFYYHTIHPLLITKK